MQKKHFALKTKNHQIASYSSSYNTYEKQQDSQIKVFNPGYYSSALKGI